MQNSLENYNFKNLKQELFKDQQFPYNYTIQSNSKLKGISLLKPNNDSQDLSLIHYTSQNNSQFHNNSQQYLSLRKSKNLTQPLGDFQDSIKSTDLNNNQKQQQEQQQEQQFSNNKFTSKNNLITSPEQNNNNNFQNDCDNLITDPDYNEESQQPFQQQNNQRETMYFSNQNDQQQPQQPDYNNQNQQQQYFQQDQQQQQQDQEIKVISQYTFQAFPSDRNPIQQQPQQQQNNHINQQQYSSKVPYFTEDQLNEEFESFKRRKSRKNSSTFTSSTTTEHQSKLYQKQLEQNKPSSNTISSSQQTNATNNNFNFQQQQQQLQQQLQQNNEQQPSYYNSKLHSQNNSFVLQQSNNNSPKNIPQINLQQYTTEQSDYVQLNPEDFNFKFNSQQQQNILNQQQQFQQQQQQENNIKLQEIFNYQSDLQQQQQQQYSTKSIQNNSNNNNYFKSQPTSHTKKNNTEKIDKFLETQESYQTKSRRKSQDLKYQNLQKEIKEETFHPTISKNSQKLIQQKNNNTHQRLYDLSQFKHQLNPKHQNPQKKKQNKRSKSLIRTEKVSDLLYQDAQRRHKQITKKSSSPNLPPQKYLSQQSEHLLKQKFLKEFESICQKIDSQQKQQHFQNTEQQQQLIFYNMAETFEILLQMGFVKYTNSQNLEKILMDQDKHLLFVMWNILGAPIFSQTILKDNLFEFLLAVLNMNLSPQYNSFLQQQQQNQQQRFKRSKSSISFKQSQQSPSQDQQNNQNQINQLQQKMLNTLEIGYFQDKLWILTDQEKQAINKSFDLFYRNRLTNEQKKPFQKQQSQIQNNNDQQYTFHPKISSLSTQLADQYREKILQQATYQLQNNELDLNLTSNNLTHQDLLLLRQKQVDLQTQQKKQQLQQQEMKDCSFTPDISSHTLQLNDTQKSHSQERKSQKLHHSRPKLQDKTNNEIDWETNQQNCTFKPDLSKSNTNNTTIKKPQQSILKQEKKLLLPQNTNSSMHTSILYTQDSQRQLQNSFCGNIQPPPQKLLKNNQQVYTQKEYCNGLSKNIERMRRAREEKQKIQELKVKGTTNNQPQKYDLLLTQQQQQQNNNNINKENNKENQNIFSNHHEEQIQNQNFQRKTKKSFTNTSSSTTNTSSNQSSNKSQLSIHKHKTQNNFYAQRAHKRIHSAVNYQSILRNLKNNNNNNNNDFLQQQIQEEQESKQQNSNTNLFKKKQSSNNTYLQLPLQKQQQHQQQEQSNIQQQQQLEPDNNHSTTTVQDQYGCYQENLQDQEQQNINHYNSNPQTLILRPNHNHINIQDHQQPNQNNYQEQIQQQQFYSLDSQKSSQQSSQQSPLLFVDVNLGNGKVERITINEGDNSQSLATQFASKHGLDQNTAAKFKQLLDHQMNSMLCKIEEDDLEEQQSTFHPQYSKQQQFNQQQQYFTQPHNNKNNNNISNNFSQNNNNFKKRIL